MNAMQGTVTLTRLALRRDRIRLGAWILVVVGLAALMTALSAAMMPTPQDAIQATRLMAGARGMRVLGLPSGATVGGNALLRGHLTLAILTALMSTSTVARHTRQNEETGRAELIGAGVVGRYASLAAAVVVGASANITLALLSAATLIVNGMPVHGSLVAGASLGAIGLVFVAVAAVTTQLSASTRGATAIAVSVLGVSFLASGIGNMLGTVDASGLRVTASPSLPTWLSPIGWAQQMRPYGGDHWWPLWLHVGLFTVLLPAAGILANRRDHGGGALPTRAGRMRARAGMLHPYGLVAHLQRGTLIGWAAGILAFGLVMGAGSAQLASTESRAAEWTAFRTPIIGMADIGVTIYLVGALLRMCSDETDGQLETVLATATSRVRLATAYLLNALPGALGLLALFLVSFGLTAGGTLRPTLEAGLVQVPAILAVGGGVVALSGLGYRWVAPASWAMFTVSILAGPLFGPAFALPQWLRNLSPFTHMPAVGAGGITTPAAATTAPLVTVTATAAALIAIGLFSWHRRDLALPT